MKRYWITCISLLLLNLKISAQEYVNVTIRHYPGSSNVVRAFVPGEFNNWGPNSSGVITTNAPSRMTFSDSLNCYVKVLRLRTGEYNYKFHEHYNASGTQWEWFTDPLNPLINLSDNNNSILKVAKAMIFQVLPKNESIVTAAEPTLVAGVFSGENDRILPEQSTVYLDGTLLTTFEGKLNTEFSLLSFKLPELENGSHQIVLNVVTENGESATDSTTFIVVGGNVSFVTPSIDSVWAAVKTIRWQIGMNPQEVTGITLKQLDSYTQNISIQSKQLYEYQANLKYGKNRYVVSVTDTAGNVFESDTLRLFYPQPKKPQPEIHFELNASKIQLKAVANDPLEGAVQYSWATQITNVAELPGVDGCTDEYCEIDIPTTPGDYAIKLTVTNEDDYSNSTINFFTIKPQSATPGSAVIFPELNTVPSWVGNAQIYCLFIKGFTPQGTIQAAIDSLKHIKNMGFNVIWVLPVMDVEGIIDQGTNIGYNIIDFYNVEPFYGSNADFKDFVNAAHEMGLRVILDVTPNHSSRSHSIALDVRSKQEYSRYYDFYQHQIISHNDNGLGQSVSGDGIVYYSGFSDALLNWNWSDAEARQYMIEVYAHWLREYDIDGFRFDVYWGPHRRYGLQEFDQPLRAALRAAKADILLLGETDGTGPGSEVNYADTGGGFDVGYDWRLKGTIWNMPSIGSLENGLYNAGYRPGPNSYFLRFLENQDEDRVAYRYQSIEKTIPVSTAIFMSTGIPELFQGQEVGMGYGMGGNKDYRVRSTVNWQNPHAITLVPHYQKLAQIRAQFPAFRRQMEDQNKDGQINSSDPTVQPRLACSSTQVYAFGRPFLDQNGIVVINFSNIPRTVTVTARLDQWAEFSGGFQPSETYFVNNLYLNSSTAVSGTELEQPSVYLDAYSVAICTISLTEEHVELPALTVDVAKSQNNSVPDVFRLFPSYPNPFNATTTIRYQLAQPAQVTMEIYNCVGQNVNRLVYEKQAAGFYQVNWEGQAQNGESVSSGIYLCRLQANKFVETIKFLLVR